MGDHRGRSNAEIIADLQRQLAESRARTAAVPPPGPLLPSMTRLETLIARITDYLAKGGLFNPEYMEHDKVRDLLMECRDALAAERPQGNETREEKATRLVRESGKRVHSNDCATSCAPAEEPGPCDCNEPQPPEKEILKVLKETVPE